MLSGRIKKLNSDNLENRFGIIEYDEGQKLIVYFMQKDLFEIDPFRVNDEVIFKERIDQGASQAVCVQKMKDSRQLILRRHYKKQANYV